MARTCNSEPALAGLRRQPDRSGPRPDLSRKEQQDAGSSSGLPAHQLTRRALLALAGTPVAAAIATERDGSNDPTSSVSVADVDPIIRLWQQLHGALSAREQAFAARDYIEAELVRIHGYPRVRLPPEAAGLARYAAAASDIDQALGADQPRLRLQLKRQLRQVQDAWMQAADAAGLIAALTAEDHAYATVRAATDKLLTTPATSLVGIRFKLAAIIAAGQAGSAGQMDFPWPALRGVLADLAA